MISCPRPNCNGQIVVGTDREKECLLCTRPYPPKEAVKLPEKYPRPKEK